MDRKLVVLVDSGAKMSRGKYAAQAIHAALTLVGAHPDTAVVVLGAKRSEIEDCPVQIRDAGRTEVVPGTLTAGARWSDGTTCAECGTPIPFGTLCGIGSCIYDT